MFDVVFAEANSIPNFFIVILLLLLGMKKTIQISSFFQNNIVIDEITPHTMRAAF